MAVSSVSTMKLELPSKPVQEVLKTSGKQVPERYIYQHQHKTSVEQSKIKCMDSPVIDFGLLLSLSSHQHEELQKLQTTLSSWGCFQLINHGLSSSLLNQIRDIGKDFFSLPLETKQQHSRTLDCSEGYGNDTVSENHSYNWNDRLQFKVHPLDNRNFKFWPEYLPNFRERVEEYTMEVKRVLQMIQKVIAKSLNLEENIFLQESGGLDGINMFARFNYYPPCSSPDKVLGVKPHSDSTIVSILLQDREVEGLQVLKDNQWFNVPIIPDALFIHIGDQLEIMSNGILKSDVHKVIIDKERERVSIAMVCLPHTEKEIGPLCELIDEERPQQYKKVKNYVDLFFQYYSREERAITALKI